MAKAGPHKREKLAPVTVSRLLKAGQKGKHCDGGGLWLYIGSATTASWVVRYRLDGRDREAGIGKAQDMTLAEARKIAADMRAIKAQGRDPLNERRRQHEMAFGSCADELLNTKARGWRNAKTEAIRRNLLRDYADAITDMPVAAIDIPTVKRVLEPIWLDKATTARRLRQLIEQTLDYAAAHGYRSGENPARLVVPLLPKQSGIIQHHKAVPVADMPAFMRDLRQREGSAAKALALIVLTAVRTNEALGARWSEINLDDAVWTVPPERTKTAHELVVPLSETAVALLANLPGSQSPGDFVFVRDGKALSNMACSMLLRRMLRIETVHGFRSTFRDWCSQQGVDREVAELALGHRIGNAVEQAYARSDLLQRRRKVMQAWADYCNGAAEDTTNVIHLRAEAVAEPA